MVTMNAHQSAVEKATGMALAVTPSRKSWLLAARRVAVNIAQRDGEVTTDDVREYYLTVRNIDIGAILGRAMGSIFRSRMFKDTGRMVQTTVVSSHRRKIAVWELV